MSHKEISKILFEFSDSNTKDLWDKSKEFFKSRKGVELSSTSIRIVDTHKYHIVLLVDKTLPELDTDNIVNLYKEFISKLYPEIKDHLNWKIKKHDPNYVPPTNTYTFELNSLTTKKEVQDFDLHLVVKDQTKTLICEWNHNYKMNYEVKDNVLSIVNRRWYSSRCGCITLAASRQYIEVPSEVDTVKLTIEYYLLKEEKYEEKEETD